MLQISVISGYMVGYMVHDLLTGSFCFVYDQLADTWFVTWYIFYYFDIVFNIKEWIFFIMWVIYSCNTLYIIILINKTFTWFRQKKHLHGL